jgi:hypothetical protein
MKNGKDNIVFPSLKLLSVLICILSSLVFGLTVSFHDYIPVHPPSYLLLAEDKLNYKFAGSISKASASLGSCFVVADRDDHALFEPSANNRKSLISAAAAGNIIKYSGFFSLSADLPPPA